MKIIMFNDCSYVGESLVVYLPESFHVIHLKRSRDLLSKTLGVLWKTLTAKGDVYHVHYLLQDCWLSLKFGKRPIIGHAHGSDVRDSLDHFAWGKLVRANLEGCDKIVVSTPNLLEKATEYNENTEYIPNLVDENVFYPKARRKATNRIRVLVAAASDWRVKGTDKIVRALKIIEDEVEASMISYGVDAAKTLSLAKRLGLHINMLRRVPHKEMSRYYWNADTVIAAIGIGGTLGVVALEAISCGRPTITRVSSSFEGYEAFPLLDVSEPEEIAEAILYSRRDDLWEKEYAYYKSNHDPHKITKRFMKIYSELVDGKKCD